MSENKDNLSVDHLARHIHLVIFDFDGVFTDNRVLVMQDGSEGVWCSRADGLGLQRLRRSGLPILVLSTEKNPVVTARCRKLELECIQGMENKADRLRQEVHLRGLNLADVAFVGNDLNDLECLRIVGFPACVADAYPEVKSLSRYCTIHSGGYGAVREFCDFLLSCRELCDLGQSGK
jgi:3-deoxy-D-manno-octulosonate 8-phosphate phosphatase (KDO 8-P phosphatase)